MVGGKVEQIEFENIGKLTMEFFNNRSGILHFLPKKPFSFKTRNLLSGEKRHYPTIEFVEEIQEVEEFLNETMKNYKLNP